MFDIEKTLSEFGLTQEKYEELLKDCSDKVHKISDLDWCEISEKYNIGWNGDSIRKAQQPNLLGGTFVSEYYKWKESQNNNKDNNEYLNEYQNTKRELERLKIQYRDERNAWSKQNYIAARAEQKLDYLEERLSDQGKVNFEIHEIPRSNGDTDLLVVLSDLHIGQCFSSTWGEYNSDIAKERLEKYLNEVIRIGILHNASKVHTVLLGDVISGNIHKTIQITNRENVIEQIKLASEYISSFCYELTKAFSNVYLYDVPGNHSRLDTKEDAMKDERLDSLISWSVCQSLKHIENFHSMLHKRFDTTIGEAYIRENSYILLHGDNDSMTKQGIADLSLMLGFVPKYLIMGHKHVPAMNEFNGVRVYQSGSLSGSGDDYTIERRMAGKASQLVLVCNDNGVECTYNVMLS